MALVLVCVWVGGLLKVETGGNPQGRRDLGTNTRRTSSGQSLQTRPEDTSISKPWTELCVQSSLSSPGTPQGRTG
jgi:hypothetical protein